MTGSAVSLRAGVLGDIADVLMGQSPVGSSYNRARIGAPLINGPTEFTDRHPVPKQWSTAPVRFCKADDVLICVRGSSTGRMNIADQHYCIGRGVAAVRAKRGNDQNFVTYALSAVVSDLLKLQTGSTFPSIDSRVINGGSLLVPLLREQEQIGEALFDADDLIASLERLIAKKQAIKQGMMQQLLTGRIRLPEFTGEWQPARLGELLAYEQPGRYLVSSADYTDTGTPVLTAGKTFLLGHTLERHGIFTNVPVIIFDDFTTASKYVDFPFKAKSSAMKMLSARPGVNLRYIFERMQLIDFVTVDHKRRWIAEFSNIEILTPGKDEQVAIAGVLEGAATEIAILAQRLEKAQAIKTGMMQQLLTGRTRLPAEATS